MGKPTFFLIIILLFLEAEVLEQSKMGGKNAKIQQCHYKYKINFFGKFIISSIYKKY